MRHKGFIFVLMPFDESFDDIYAFGVKQTVNQCGYYCERVDEQIFEGSILSRIYNQIEKADVIIADLSDKNPNVFYETGYAHALNKTVILLTQNSEDIPFDLKHYHHIVYNKNIKKLSEGLTLKLNWFSENQNNESIDKSGFIEFYNKGVKIVENSTIVFDILRPKHPFETNERTLDNISSIRFTLNIFNSGVSIVDNISNIGIVIDNIFKDSRFSKEDNGDIVQLPNDKVLLTFGGGDYIFPQSWRTYSLHVGYKEDLERELKNGELRVFKEDGFMSLPFSIKYKTVDFTIGRD